MTALLDAFWRAAAYCLRPRVILLSILPVLIAGALVGGLGYFFWADAVAAVRAGLESSDLLAALFRWLDSMGASAFRSVLAPLVVVMVAVPVVVMLALLLVSVLMTPALVKLVAARRFADLERRHGGSLWQSLTTSLVCTVLALLAFVVSLPLWLVPPLALVLPPLIWGWLTYRVMAFDALSEHASAAERRQIFRERRGPLLAMGVVAGALNAAPSLLFAFSALSLIFAPLLALVAVWIYTLVFAFASLWFSHYTLAALHALRQDEALKAEAAKGSMASPPVPAVDAGAVMPTVFDSAALPPPAMHLP